MFKKLFSFVFLLGLFLASFAYYQYWQWQKTPISLPNTQMEIVIPKGSSVKAVSEILQKSGVLNNRLLFELYARYTGLAKQLKAGTYTLKQGQTEKDILLMIANGDVSHRALLLVEGWTFKQIRQAIEKQKDIEQTLSQLSEKELMEKLQLPQDYPAMEGLIYPNTYLFEPGTKDITLLKQAYEQGQKKLMHYWLNRAEGLPLKSPYEALILASIVEKETGHGEDRARIAGVFINRLKINMPLQTDPTVIYGMGEKYQGRIRKIDLQTDTPWNTYTRNGLPPTPIASPGELALQAVLHPEEHAYFYFVARGDGTSAFAKTLSEHNKNVQEFILKKGP